MGQKRDDARDKTAGHMGQNGGKTGQAGGGSMGHPRARTPSSGGMSHLSHGTHWDGTHGTHGTSVVVGQGQTYASLRICPSPTARSEVGVA